MKPKIIAVVNQKGGTGKTTLSMNLAAGLERRGPTALLDADPQRSATQWAELGLGKRPFPVPVFAAVDGAVVRELEPVRRYRYVVVDCPPAMHSDTVGDVLARADVALIPVLPSPMDLWASVAMADMITRARDGNRGLKAWLVLNQIETRNAMSRSMETALAEFTIPATRTGLRRRAIYRRAALEGSSVYDFTALGKAAAQELDDIILEVIEK